MAEHHDIHCDLDASLAQLGVHEIEERLELAPLLAAPGELQPGDACQCSCTCDDTPEDPIQEIIDAARDMRLAIDGLGY